VTLPADARTANWSSDLSASYVEPEQPNADTCNAFLIELIACSDRLCAGSALMVDNGASWFIPSEVLADGSSVNVVGAATTETLALRGLSGTDARTEQILALAWVGRQLGASSARSAGVPWIPIAVGLAVVAIVGACVAWYADGQSRASQAERVTQASILAAGRDYTERLRVAQQTNQPIGPPTPVELAAADAIRTAAAQAREAGVGQAVAEAVQGVGKAAALVVALWLGFKLFGTDRS
jgi:hypothetical protein